MHAHLYGEVAVHQLSRQRRVSWSQARTSPHLPLSPGQELSLANRCNLGRLGQWRETCPQSFDLSSCFFLFCLTVLDSCLYFYAVVTAFSSSFLPRKVVLASQDILLVSWVDLSYPLNLEPLQSPFPTTPSQSTHFEKVLLIEGGNKAKQGVAIY